MTTPYMKRHGGVIPIRSPKQKPKKPSKPKPPPHGSIPLNEQAEAIHTALGWMDSQQFHNLALDVVKSMHEAGYRVAKISKINVKAIIAERRRKAQERIAALEVVV